MAPAAISPESSGTTTPTTATASALTEAGIKKMSTISNDSNMNLAALDASMMTVELTASPRTVPEPNSAEVKSQVCDGSGAAVRRMLTERLSSQRTCTDHMITAKWTEENGWEAPELKPYGPFSIMPTASVLHYATECFEGLKLYRGQDGHLRLFRPEKNCRRMKKSAARIALPDFDPEELEKLIVRLCAQDGPKWLPKGRPGSFL